MSGTDSTAPVLFRPGSMYILLAIAASSAITLGGCAEAQPESTPKKDAPPTIQAEVFTVQQRPWPKIVRTQGSLIADEVSVVGSRVTGRIAEVHVDLGDEVHAGDPLVTLDQEEFELRVKQAQAQLNQAMAAVGLQPDAALESLVPENSPPVRQERAMWDEAKATLARAQRLKQDKVITQAELEQTVAAEEVAAARYASSLNSVQEKIAIIGLRMAELDLAKQNLRNSVVEAPFDGLIQQRQVAPGTYVQIGDAISTLVRTDPLRFRGTMPERYAQELKLGQKVVLQVESMRDPFTVEITRISPSLDLMSRALLFEAKVENQDGVLRSGLFAEAQVVLDPQAESIFVPASSVLEFAGTQKIWKVTDGLAGEQEVLIGQRRPEGVEILSGLSSGDVILLDAIQGKIAQVQALQTSSNVASHAPDTKTEETTGSESGSAGLNAQLPLESQSGGSSTGTSLE